MLFVGESVNVLELHELCRSAGLFVSVNSVEMVGEAMAYILITG